MKNKPIILVCGEPESIFLEIFFKSLKKKKYKSPLIIICSKNLFMTYFKKVKLKLKINDLEMKDIEFTNLNKKNIYLINVNLNKNKIQNINQKNKYLNQCFEIAFKLIKKKYTFKFINGPINKTSFLNKKFLGITEFISAKFKVKNVGMLIFNEKLSVCPLTTHLPIKLVSKNINKKLIHEKIYLIDRFFKDYLNIAPKIGVTGLNPHCESILKYNEDKKIIPGVISALKKKKINVIGPLPADTIFLEKYRKKFDVILGMYHDQVLTPMKALFEFDAINITIGLPFLRITPDHGPNQKMVKKNNSNPASLIKALNFLDKF
jgi:4-hydroxy-L-threonine phosphate dehydrogenase PdxA